MGGLLGGIFGGAIGRLAMQWLVASAQDPGDLLVQITGMSLIAAVVGALFGLGSTLGRGPVRVMAQEYSVPSSAEAWWVCCWEYSSTSFSLHRPLFTQSYNC